MSYLHEYEQICRDMNPTQQMEENALAFKEWRCAQRSEHLAYERWLIICGVRLKDTPSDREAVVLPFREVSDGGF